MLLNRIEKGLMNNPLRALIQRRVEARRLLALGGHMRPGGRALEVGCGRGVGVEIVLDAFGAERVDAFDLDPDMVERARRRLAARGPTVRLWVGDAAHIDAPDGAYDAVFDFGILHHVPDWRAAISEVTRVLTPGGRFYAEEVFDRVLAHPVTRRLLEHPTEDRFGAEGFAAAIERAGLQVIGRRTVGLLGGWFVADKPLAAV